MRSPLRPLPTAVARWTAAVRVLRWLDGLAAGLAIWGGAAIAFPSASREPLAVLAATDRPSGAVRVSGQNTLAPGASGSEGTFGPTIANQLFHCHFDVAGTKAQFPAAIKRRDFSAGSGGDIVVVPAD